MDYEARRDKLRKAMKATGVDALLVTSFVNVTYLTGFTGDDSYLLVRHDGQVIISDGRYLTQLEEECPGLDALIRGPGRGMLQAIARVVSASGIARLGIEADSMSVSLRDQVVEKLPKVAVVPTSGLIEHLRQIKDKEEVTQIREALRFAEKAFAVVRATLRPDHSEKQIADDLDHQQRLFGARGASFPPIVAIDERAAMAHAIPTRRTLGEGDFVLIDWGARGPLYKSDLTRVLVTGKISPKLRRVYGVVLNAQARAIAAVRPGVPAHEVDAVARNLITDAGFRSILWARSRPRPGAERA